MSNSNANVYGVIGQPLTPDYLAKQLPLFLHKVPKSIEVKYLIQFIYVRNVNNIIVNRSCCQLVTCIGTHAILARFMVQILIN